RREDPTHLPCRPERPPKTPTPRPPSAATPPSPPNHSPFHLRYKGPPMAPPPPLANDPQPAAPLSRRKAKVTNEMIRAGRAAHHTHGCGAVREIYKAMIEADGILAPGESANAKVPYQQTFNAMPA